MLLQFYGTLHYSNDPTKLVLEIDKELSNYYFAQVPKYIRLRRQKYPPHISIVRHEDYACHNPAWGRYEGQEVQFLYEPIIYNDDTYYWLNCFSTRLEEIRLELGLEVSSPYTRPPSGFDKCFHATIGNVKP